MGLLLRLEIGVEKLVATGVGCGIRQGERSAEKERVTIPQSYHHSAKGMVWKRVTAEVLGPLGC